MVFSRLSAAGVVLALACALALTACAQEPRAHTCSATDKQFLAIAQLNMTALGAWSDDYMHGNAKAGEVVKEANAAARRMAAISPSDPALVQTRTLMRAMFSEYSKAIQAKARNRDAGTYIFRAYGLANFAHDVLVQAGPALQARGCDVAPLL